jgi:hypothetical protein
MNDSFLQSRVHIGRRLAGNMMLLVALLIAFCGNRLEAASFKVSTIAEFTDTAAALDGVVASNTNGVDANYLRIMNTNPGMDPPSALDRFANGGNLVWTKKRRIDLTVPASQRSTRTGEKVQVDIQVVGNARTDWSDLRLTDDTGASLPFRLMNYETPVDNPNTPVKLLFHANAGTIAAANYWLYYGNAEASGVATLSIDPFYLLNNNYEDGFNNWARDNSGTTAPAGTVVTIENNLSITPEGFVGLPNKSCLLIYYPEAATANGWCGARQDVALPCTGTWVLSAFKKTITPGLDATGGIQSRIRLEDTAGSNNEDYRIPAGISDWNLISVERTTTLTTLRCICAIAHSGAKDGWRERRMNFDWVVLEPKFPLSVFLNDEIDAGYLKLATYVSRPFDTSIPSPEWGALVWNANTTAAGTSVEFYTRTAATQAGLAAAPWDGPVTVNGDTIPSPSHRWVQFRAMLRTADTGNTPLLDEVELFYVLPTTNLAITAPATVKAGEYFEFGVAARDAFNATNTAAVETCEFTSSSGATSFPVSGHTFQSGDAGYASFQGRHTQTGAFTIFASATTTGITSGSAAITCLPGDTTTITFVGLPGTVTAGASVNGSIRALDQYGNINTADTGVLALSCTDPFPASYSTSITLVGGQAALNDLRFFTTGAQTLTVRDNGRGFSDAVTIAVTPAATSALRLTALPDQYQNTPAPLKIEAIDAFDNVVTAYSEPVTLGISSGTITPVSGNLVNGSATVNFQLSATGNLTMTATDSTGLIGQLSVSCRAVPPTSLDGFLVDTGPLQLAGVPFVLNVTARDGFDNVLTNYKGACRIRVASSTTPPFKPSLISSATPEFTTGYGFIDGILAIPVTISGASPTIILWVEDAQDSTKFGYVQVNVAPSGLDHFDVLCAGTVTAGASHSFEVIARDSMNNIITNYTGTITLTHDANGGLVSLPAGYTFVPGDKGRHVFSGAEAARFTFAEAVRLRVEDSGRVGMSNPIVVTSNNASPVLTITPVEYLVQVKKPVSFDLTAKDEFGNQLQGFTGTIAFGYTNLATGVPNYTFQAFENGYHRFFQAASGTQLGEFQILATETVSLATATSEKITVINDSTKNLAFTVGTLNVTAGTSFTFTVNASDSAGNINPYYSGTIRFSTLDSAAQLPPDSTLTNGQGTFETTFFTAGAYTLNARDTLTPGIYGTMTVNVTPAPAARLEFTLSTYQTKVGLPAFPYSLAVLDSYGNLSSITSPVSVSCTDTNPAAKAPLVFNLTNQSLVNDTWFLASAGIQLLIATCPILPEARSEPILASATTPFAITGKFPVSVSNEYYYPFLVQIVDQYGNPTPVANQTITLAGTWPGGGSWDANPGNYLLAPSDYGTKLFNMRWQMGDATAPGTWTTTISYPTLANLVLSIFVDNPRYSVGPASSTMASLRLSLPDRDVLASQPFQLFLNSMTVRDTPATISGQIDFLITDGEIFVSSGTVPTDYGAYKKALFIPPTSPISEIPLWAYVTRSGVQTVVAQPAREPVKQGTVSFVVKPDTVIQRVTVKANSPQRAKVSFPFITEWWDYYNNYAENAVGSFVFNASTTGSFLLSPSGILVNGRGGKFDPDDNTRWFDTRFHSFAAATDIKNDLVLNQLSLRGIYDEDFTDNSFDNGLWDPVVRNCGDAGATGHTGTMAWQNMLYLSTIGNSGTAGQLYSAVGSNDTYSFIGFNWPAADTSSFTAKLYVKRLQYDAFQRNNLWSAGLMMRDGADGDLKPRYVALQMKNYNDLIYNSIYGYALFRGTPNTNAARNAVPDQAANCHPKWLRLQFNGVNRYQCSWSNDDVEANYITFNAFTFANVAAYTDSFTTAALDARWSVWGGYGSMVLDDPNNRADIFSDSAGKAYVIFERDSVGANSVGQNFQTDFNIAHGAAFTDGFGALSASWSAMIGTIGINAGRGRITTNGSNIALVKYDMMANGVNTTLVTQLRADFRWVDSNYRVSAYLEDINGRVATGTPQGFYNGNQNNLTWAFASAFTPEVGFDDTRVRYFGFYIETALPNDRVDMDDVEFPQVTNQYRVSAYLIDANGLIATGPALPGAATWYTNAQTVNTGISAANFPGEPGFDLTKVRYFGWYVQTHSPEIPTRIDNVDFPLYTPVGFDPATRRLGIFAVANSPTFPGGLWVTELKVNRYAGIGTFTSVVYDTGSPTSSIGPMALTTTVPAGTQVRVYGKSGNTPATLPAAWTYLGDTTSVNMAGLAGNRYFQYALELRGAGPVANIYDQTPIVHDVTIPYAVSGLGARFDKREIVNLIASLSPATPVITSSATIEIKGGTVADLLITAPAIATAGLPFTIGVKALDAAGNVADDAQGTWAFSSNDGNPFPAQLPPNYTLVPNADKGQHTFYNSTILKNAIVAQFASVTVSDGLVSSSTRVQISPGAIDSFVASAVSPQIASVAFPVYMKALDAFGNVKIDYASPATFYDNKTGGSSEYSPPLLPGGTWTAGFATLTPGVLFTKAETVKVTVQSENRTGQTNGIVIRGGTAASLLMAVSTNQPISGDTFSITVTALDQFDNVSPSYTGTVHFTCTDPDPLVVMPPDYTFLATDFGSRTWNVPRLISPGPVTLSVTDTAVATMSRNYPVTVLPGPVSRFSISLATPQTASVPFNILITAYDAYGHIKTNFSSSVSITGSFSYILPDAPVSGFSNGQLLIPSAMVSHDTLPFTGWLVASFGSAIGTVSFQLLPPAGAFNHYALETVPATPTAGDAFKLVIKAVGANGAVFTSYAPTSIAALTGSNSSGLAIDPPLIPEQVSNFEIGVKETYARIWEAGTITIWAADTVVGKIGSLTLTIAPTNLAYFEVAPGTSTVEPHPNTSYQVVNGTFPVTITAFDAIGNVKSDYSNRVQLYDTGTGVLSIASATLLGGSTTVALYYDAPGEIRITASDSIFVKSGQSKKLSFFGPLATFTLACSTDQTDNIPFLCGITAYDTYGQMKLNALASVTANQINWTGGAGAITVAPAVFTPTWVDGIANQIFTINVPDTANATLTFRVIANPVTPGSASGIQDLYVHRSQPGTLDHFSIEALSPQKAGIPFFLLVKALDANNAVISNYAADTTLTATTTIVPGLIPAAEFVSGAYATSTALIVQPGTYLVTASGSNALGSTTIVVTHGPLAAIRVNVPSNAPLGTAWPNQMSVMGLTSTGDIKTDYVPDGVMLFKLNASATGFLGMATIEPTDFSGGIGTVTAQTYNKSQIIWITTKDPAYGFTHTGGPISVYGAPAKFVLEPRPYGKGSAGDPIIYNALFWLRVVVKDVNGFVVPDYADTITFSALPATTPPTDATPEVPNFWATQAFFLSYAGQHDFAMKASYSTTLPVTINLKLRAEGGSGISRTTDDLVFKRIEVFDRFVITTPTDGLKRQKKLKFPFKVQAVSNLDNPWNNASAPMISYALVEPFGITGFIATPTQWTSLAFGGGSEVATEVALTYDQSCTASYRIMVDNGGLAEASVTVKLMLGDPEFRNAENIILEANATYVVSVFARTLDKALATGTGYLKVKLYEDEALGTAVLLYAPDGSSDTLGPTRGHHGWQRYWWSFSTGAVATQASVILSVSDGVVYFDAVMLEKAPRLDEPAPSAYTPHPFTFSHPASESTFDIGGKGQYWQW